MQIRSCLYLRIALSSAIFSHSTEAQPAQRTPETGNSRSRITVEDLVRHAVIGNPPNTQVDDDLAGRSDVAVISPDGRWSAVVVRRGNVERLANIGRLLLYKTADLMRAPQPEFAVESASTVARLPLASVTWLPDSRRLFFAGTDGDRPSQVYSLDVVTRQREQVTHDVNSVETFAIGNGGRVLVTTSAETSVPPHENPICRKRGCLVTAGTLWEAEGGRSQRSAILNVYDFDARTSVRIERPELAHPNTRWCSSDLKGGISPDGRFAVRSCVLRETPSWWRNYENDPELVALLEAGNEIIAQTWILVDLRTGAARPISDAPFRYDQSAPIWLDNGARLLIVGAFEPLAGSSAGELKRRRSNRTVLEVDPVSLRARRIEELEPRFGHIVSREWDDNRQILRLEISADQVRSKVAYRRVGRDWIRLRNLPPQPGASGMPVLTVRESLNDRPILTAIDPTSGIEVAVLDPNPWLARRRLGKVEEVQWPVGDRFWRGGLYYPPDYTPGDRRPLVILTHGFNPDRFSLHGYARNYPAQALAAHGMMVLQVEERLRDVIGTPQEWTTVQAGYEGAIDYLDRLTLIDRTRVGMQGWSRTGPHVGYTITHSSYLIAAGAFTSTADFGWSYYLAAGAMREIELGYGSPPFGQGLQNWANYAPSFNLDKVNTPMLMWADGSVGSLWDWYAGLRRLNKPVEYWFLPDGSHDVFKVGERLNTYHLLVDWFRFWLQGEEDGDAEKANQYARWRQLRDLQCRNPRSVRNYCGMPN